MKGNGTSFFDEKPIFILDHASLDILDVNQAAENLYGYTREELCRMNLNDLGQKKKRVDVVNPSAHQNGSADKLWIQKKSNGDEFYVQFTHHSFNHQGKSAKLAVAHDVTVQVEAGETRRVKFPKFVKHESNFPLAEIEWGEDLRVRNWTERAQELLGWSEDEVVGRKDFFEQLIDAGELNEAKTNISKAVEQQDVYFTAEGKVNTKTGGTLVCRWYNSLNYDERGDLYSIHSLVTDISGRKESENLFRALSEESLVGVYLVQDGKFKYVNPRFAEIFGYASDEMIGKLSPADLAHPDDIEMVENNIAEPSDIEADSKEYDFKCRTKDGREIDVSVYGSAISYMGKPAVVGTLLDVTSTKETMQKYRASVESFQDLFDSISDAIYIQDKDGRFLEVNRGAVEMYGYDQSYFIGKSPEILAAPGKVDMQKTQKFIKKAIEGTPQSFEWWGKRKNGEVFPKEVVSNPGTYFGEDVVITIARDISERYDAEEQLRKNEEMFRQLFQNSPIPITLMDKRQEIRRVNSAFSKTFGYETKEVRGINIDQLIVPEDEKDIAKEISDKIYKGKTAHHYGKRRAKDGSLLDTIIYGVPVIVDNKTVAIFGIYVDYTDRKKAEEKVKKSLKEKEVLLAEIHHRVKNNLAVITGLLELQAYNTGSEEATDVLRTSQMRVNSIALIHEKLYQNENLSEISFDVYLEQLTDVIFSSLKTKQVKIDINIEADPVQLTIGQAIPCGLILNELVTNAHKHAFPDQQEGAINISLTKEGQTITLTITHNGVGIPEDISLERPSSLGLKLIRTLSRQLNGQAEFCNADPGTEFNLQFAYKE